MIEISILYIVTLTFIVIREYYFAQERQKFLDRIQAKDLPEYKALEKPVKKPKKEIKKEVDFL